MLAAAVDAHLFYRMTLSGDEFPGLYHSGVWIDLFGEARPFPDLVANVRVSVVNPASSYGIVDETALVAWPALTWKPSVGEARGWFRAFDLGRRTFGAGLVVQDQEGSGAAARLSWRAARVRADWLGTDTFSLDGDFLAVSADLWGDALGVWTFGTQSWMGGYGAAVYSAHTFPSGLVPLAEAAIRSGQPAGMAGLRFERDRGGRWAGGATAQLRGYGPGFADDLAGRIGHDYLAPEQELLDFVRADNLFVYDDGVAVAAGRAWFVARPLPWLHLRVDQEAARMWWAEPDASFPTLWYWWRYDVIACARSPDNICFDAFVTNRMTSAIYLPTEASDVANYPMLFDRRFIGMEGRLRF